MSRSRPTTPDQLRKAALRERASVARRYSLGHRRAGPRRRLRWVAVRAVAVALLLGGAVALASQARDAAGAAVASVVRSVEEVLAPPAVQDRRGEAVGAKALGTAPVLDPLDALARDARYVVSGRVPPLVLEGARPRIEILVNGAVAASPSLDDRGRFSATIVLSSGQNVIRVASIRPGERAETAPRTVTLDTVPPPLSLRSPAEGANVDGAALRVEGFTEPGARVTVNGNAASVAFDGSFVATIGVAPGTLALELVAVDAAGNETKRVVTVTVKTPAAESGTLRMSVLLDRAKARTGEPVLADVLVLDAAGGPARDVAITLQVGPAVVSVGRTDAAGRYRGTFNAPPADGLVQVVALGATSTASGRSSVLLEVTPPPSPTPAPSP